MKDGSQIEGGAMLARIVRVNAVQGWRRLLDFRRQSRLMLAVILLFVVGYAGLSFWLFGAGLRFVDAFPGLGPLLIERLMFLLFAVLLVLLTFSNLVIGYANLFRNRETQFLLTLPIPADTVFRWKLVESTLLASWAFVFLVAPLLAAYGLHSNVSWTYYLATPVLLALFVVVPGVLGAWLAIAVARLLDRRSFQVAAVIGTALLLTGVVLWWRAEPVTDELLESRVMVVLDRLMMKTRFAQFPFLPSYWLASGVQDWAEGAVAGAGFFGLVLLSHALFLGTLAATASGGFFKSAVSAVQSRGSVFWQWEWFRSWQHRRSLFRPVGPVERVVGWIRWIPIDLRAVMIKDIRLFWRDTTQWGQTLVLFGLLAAYILNLRHFSHQLTSPFWIHLVSYLNLAACSLNLATFTTRFVFPQFSLEGKRVWIIGLSPAGLKRVVLAKYALAVAASLLLTVGVTVLSCAMLRLPPTRTLAFLGAVTIMTFSLNGLAMGLGVLHPNLKEDQPGRIVSGFGGTLCLALSFVYIVLSVFLLALSSPWSWMPDAGVQLSRIGGGWALFLFVSALLGGLPLRLGIRRLRHIEP